MKAAIPRDRKGEFEPWIVKKYPNSMKRWKDNWDAISPIFKFSSDVRKVIYTTNAIESLNSTEYSCAVKPHIRAGGNRQSGIWETAIASLLA